MVHFASPLPVLVAVQPGGAAPVLKLSKLTMSASAKLASIAAVSVSVRFFIIISIRAAAPLWSRFCAQWRHEGDAKAKGGALAEVAFNIDRASMHIHNSFRDGKTESGAALFA